MVTPATKTLEAVEAAMEADQGTAYRAALEKLLPKMDDAYRPTADRHRSHFGFSTAGDKCARKLWFSFKWVLAKAFKSRILRLFNRGHLEEARFLALLMGAGFEIHFETEDGGQFKIEDHNGHAGSAIDGVVMGIPDLKPDEPALAEMKTHNDKSFKQVSTKGVKIAHPKHYTQMQIYMKKYGLQWGLYMAVNKNDDDLWFELIVLDEPWADRYIERSGMIIYSDEAPARVNDSASWFECKFCDYTKICHDFGVPEINCRTCCHSTPVSNKRWHCNHHNSIISKAQQLRQDCPDHLFNPNLLNQAEVLNADTEDGWIKIEWKEEEILLGSDQGLTSQEFRDQHEV